MKLKHHLGVINHGSLVEFQLISEAARDWWSEHILCEVPVNEVPVNTMVGMFGKKNSQYVEHRYANEIYKGMLEHFED